MASNPPGKCCFMGFRHEGETHGSFQDLYGLDTYVTEPQVSECCKGKSSDAEVKKVNKYIVILTDIFGHKFNNVQLLADQLAQGTGFHVLVPDILFNDPVIDLDGSTDFQKWLHDHPHDKTRNEAVQPFLESLKKEKNPDFIGIIGYCYGAKFAVQQLSQDGLADVGAIAHPSFVSIEEVDAIPKSKPLLISAAEKDVIFTEELRHLTEDKLKENGITYQLDLFSGVEHGFAARGDISIPWVKYANEKALADQIHWFNYFGNKKD
ncbi:hypothetical protein MOUN0_L11034 [Monosporozyma unispora]|nr:hypothetical protein C6P44_001772 [Kazachstania unispora]